MTCMAKDCKSEFTRTCNVDLTMKFGQVEIEASSQLDLCEEHVGRWNIQGRIVVTSPATNRRWVPLFRTHRSAQQ